MPEIDVRNPYWPDGILSDGALLSRDLYRLLSIFAASKEISDRRIDKDDRGSVYGYSIYAFETSEVGRLITYIAASLRNYCETRRDLLEDPLALEVGVLAHPTASPSLPLSFLESLHKILHCETINFQRSEGDSIYAGHLEPYLHLYGKYHNEHWKASIDVLSWCEAAHSLV